jgi:hypothetical protein
LLKVNDKIIYPSSPIISQTFFLLGIKYIIGINTFQNLVSYFYEFICRIYDITINTYFPDQREIIQTNLCSMGDNSPGPAVLQSTMKYVVLNVLTPFSTPGP